MNEIDPQALERDLSALLARHGVPGAILLLCNRESVLPIASAIDGAAHFILARLGRAIAREIDPGHIYPRESRDG